MSTTSTQISDTSVNTSSLRPPFALALFEVIIPLFIFGDAVGVAVGGDVGVAVGERDGFIDGLLEGGDVGALLGDTVGSELSDGEPDGKSEGLSLIEGFSDGPTLGIAESDGR